MRSEDGAAAAIGRLLFLRTVPMVGTLATDQLTAVADVLEDAFYRKGDVLQAWGEPVDAIHFVVEGQVTLERWGHPAGQVGAGSALGYLALAARDPNGLAATAQSDLATLRLEADAFEELLEDSFSVCRHLLRETSRSLVGLLRQLGGTPPWGPAECEGTEAAGRDLDLVDRIVFLRQSPPFRRASINALAELARTLAEARFEPGERIFSAGEPSRGILLVTSGRVRCSAAGGAFTLGRGGALGANEALADLPRWHDAVAETRVGVLAGDTESLLDVFEDNAEMARDYLAVLARVQLRAWEALASRAGPAPATTD